MVVEQSEDLMERLMTRHLCVSDDGKSFTVLEFQDFAFVPTEDDPNAQMAGVKRFALPNGRPIHFVDDETFRIVSTGKLVHKRQSLSTFRT